MRIWAVVFELKSVGGDAVKRRNIRDVPFGRFYPHRFTSAKEIPISGHLATGLPLFFFLAFLSSVYFYRTNRWISHVRLLASYCFIIWTKADMKQKQLSLIWLIKERYCICVVCIYRTALRFPSQSVVGDDWLNIFMVTL